MRQPIVFVTDFGRDDAYAASLVGAAWRVDPHAICVEGTHGIPPGDVLAGAYQLKALARAFSGGAVFCAVVDPGVGTARRAIAVKAGRIRCVAPDNGLVSYLWDEAAADDRRAVSIDVNADASPTFHGRDVFAPFAADYRRTSGSTSPATSSMSLSSSPQHSHGGSGAGSLGELPWSITLATRSRPSVPRTSKAPPFAR